MKVIEVLAPGLLTTVQDLGREGFGPMGVSPSGAADPVALRIGNRLVGNAAIAAALEMTLLGGTFLFPEGALAALMRSEEHTSELQSRLHLVCRLLLEKKKSETNACGTATARAMLLGRHVLQRVARSHTAVYTAPRYFPVGPISISPPGRAAPPGRPSH